MSHPSEDFGQTARMAVDYDQSPFSAVLMRRTTGGFTICLYLPDPILRVNMVLIFVSIYNCSVPMESKRSVSRVSEFQ